MTDCKCKSRKKTFLFDLCLLCAIAVLVLSVFLIITLTSDEGAVVVVSVDGKRHSSYPLSEDREVIIESADGGYNVLVIKDGKAYVSSASCPDGICSRHKAINFTDESIICLPNKVVITVEGESDISGPDTVS